MRLFVALELPAGVRDAMVNATANLRSEAAGVRWSKPESMHVTLKFLGQTEASLLPPIKAALEQIISAGPVSLRLRGVGFFPDENRPRVMWCGVEASPNLAELAADIEKNLQLLGFEVETRRYVPHVTLARLNSARDVAKLVRAAAPLTSYDFGAARESQFHLFESVLKPSGSEYKKLATFHFVKDAR
jgi:RNA 2',3'-cyclic 3'-phosphodiesterase